MAATDLRQRFVQWFRRHAGTSLGLGIGLAVGIGCRYPADWKLPDNTAAMFAAVIGALATSAAVVIAVDVQSAKETEAAAARQRELRRRVKIMLLPYLADISSFFDDYPDDRKRTRAAKQVASDSKNALERIRSSRLINEELDNDGLLGLTYIEIRVTTLTHITETLHRSCEAHDTGRAVRVAYQQIALNLAELANSLVDEIREFAGAEDLEDCSFSVS